LNHTRKTVGGFTTQRADWQVRPAKRVIRAR